LIELAFGLLRALLQHREIRPGSAGSQQPADDDADQESQKKKRGDFHGAFKQNRAT
jgi:hypothetical protein